MLPPAIMQTLLSSASCPDAGIGGGALPATLFDEVLVRELLKLCNTNTTAAMALQDGLIVCVALIKRGHLDQVYLLYHLSGHLSEFYKSDDCARLKQPKEKIVSHIYHNLVMVLVLNPHLLEGLQGIDQLRRLLRCL